MRYALKRSVQVPYGGSFTINRPDLGMVGTGTTLDMLYRNVAAYRNANGIPIGLGLYEELENEICKLYPAECEPTSETLPLKRTLGLADVIRGAKAILQFKLAGSPFVPREEALRRGAICAKCPLQKSFPGTCGGGCGELRDIANALVGESYATPYDAEQNACSICWCFTAIHIKFPYSILERSLTDDMKAQFQEAARFVNCWKVPTSL